MSGRAKPCEKYTFAQNVAIIRGLKDQLRADGRIKEGFACALEPEDDIHERPMLHDWTNDDGSYYVDDVSGYPLNPELVTKV